MKVVLGLVALLSVGVFGTGCDISPPAATANGVGISQSQLGAQLTDAVQNKYALCVLQLQAPNLPASITGAGDSTVNSRFASYELSTLVLVQLISEDLARHHRTVTASEMSAARADLGVELGAVASSANTPCAGQASGAQLVAHLPPGFALDQVRYLADEEQLAAAVAHVDLGRAALQLYYFTHSSQFAQTCLSDIEVTSQAQAQSIRAAIASGSASFSNEAKQSSLDTQTAQSGGVVTPCFTSSQLQSSMVLSSVPTLATGEVSQPVQAATSSGSTVWLLLQVTSRPEVPFSSATSHIRLSLLSAQSAKISAEFNKLTSGARVTVDPRYGSWNRLQGILPPAPPPAKYLLSPSADQSAGSSVLGG